MKKNILVGQSGGPTAVINASLYGIIKEAAAHSEQIGSVYGMINGIEGFLSGHIMDLSKELSDEDLELLRLTPAAYLGSCRYKLPENLDASVYTLLFEKFEQLNIGAVFYIGGNDSMDTADKLSRWAAHNNKEISFIGVPKTIDNDLPVTDHTPGYGSAARYVASTVREIVLDASVYQQPAVTIVELMGRHAGWVTAASSLAPGDQISQPVGKTSRIFCICALSLIIVSYIYNLFRIICSVCLKHFPAAKCAADPLPCMQDLICKSLCVFIFLCMSPAKHLASQDWIRH